MTRAIDLSVILTTYERPRHLARSLASLATQRGVDGRFELIVADDGSQDETHELVREFARRASFPVRLRTHPHEGFRAAASRNNGVRGSSGTYLVFADGDCIFPPDHLRIHLSARRRGVARAGNAYRLDRVLSERIDHAAVASQIYSRWIPLKLRTQMLRRGLKDILYEVIRHSSKPKFDSCNFGIWRSDFEAVNGFDEDYRGWGCEDDDLGLRLRRNGVRVLSLVRRTCAYHLWHPLDPSCPAAWKDGPNVRRLQVERRPIRCVNGLFPPQARAA